MAPLDLGLGSRHKFPDKFTCWLINRAKNGTKFDWTFIVLNVPFTKGDPKAQQHQDSQPIYVTGDKKRSSTTENARG